MKSLLPALAALALLAGAATGLNGAEAIRPLAPIRIDTASADADALIGGRAGFSKVRVEGRSMLPFFGEDAVLVIKTIPAAKLRAGMVVVYTNRFGDTIAHRLVSAVEGGWIAQGYNNASADSTVVNDTNLLGVVYATFLSNGVAGGLELASGGTAMPVALAGPAR